MQGNGVKMGSDLYGLCMEFPRIPEQGPGILIDLVKIQGGGVGEGVSFVTILPAAQQRLRDLFQELLVRRPFLPG